MADFIPVASVDQVPVGTSKAFTVGTKTIAIFHRPEGTWYAIDDYCPHMGASLAEGTITDGVVECPWHAWQFRLTDGTWVNSPKLKIGCYPIRIVENEIQISLEK